MQEVKTQKPGGSGGADAFKNPPATSIPPMDELDFNFKDLEDATKQVLVLDSNVHTLKILPASKVVQTEVGRPMLKLVVSIEDVEKSSKMFVNAVLPWKPTKAAHKAAEGKGKALTLDDNGIDWGGCFTLYDIAKAQGQQVGGKAAAVIAQLIGKPFKAVLKVTSFEGRKRNEFATIMTPQE